MRWWWWWWFFFIFGWNTIVRPPQSNKFAWFVFIFANKKKLKWFYSNSVFAFQWTNLNYYNINAGKKGLSVLRARVCVGFVLSWMSGAVLQCKHISVYRSVLSVHSPYKMNVNRFDWTRLLYIHFHFQLQRVFHLLAICLCGYVLMCQFQSVRFFFSFFISNV